ncbi:hypothetical protein BDY19DRAFT_996312 [Irpex rosettiformis]|uniref:Uncharacterized protein n=1 Tax=Irpex rosettiformis TaxID=378272 RepID=A0ACB8TUX3_9APHY|nr:hypothetical protein BDY19DRAFT_996312 [Irpex rosettiformis]
MTRGELISLGGVAKDEGSVGGVRRGENDAMGNESVDQADVESSDERPWQTSGIGLKAILSPNEGRLSNEWPQRKQKSSSQRCSGVLERTTATIAARSWDYSVSARRFPKAVVGPSLTLATSFAHKVRAVGRAECREIEEGNAVKIPRRTDGGQIGLWPSSCLMSSEVIVKALMAGGVVFVVDKGGEREENVALIDPGRRPASPGQAPPHKPWPFLKVLPHHNCHLISPGRTLTSSLPVNIQLLLRFSLPTLIASLPARDTPTVVSAIH